MFNVGDRVICPSGLGLGIDMMYFINDQPGTITTVIEADEQYPMRGYAVMWDDDPYLAEGSKVMHWENELFPEALSDAVSVLMEFVRISCEE